MRKRSENVGNGSIVRSLNTERGLQDRKRSERAAKEATGKVYYRRPNEPQHPTSRIFEEKGRVTR